MSQEQNLHFTPPTQKRRPALSVIIPVYNAELTIDRCLESIRRQGLEDYEVLLINDGSQDNSRGLCEKWCNSDARFQLFCQQNSGPSAARNRGLEQAKGKYIAFVDSDDELAVDTLLPNVEYLERHPEVSLIQYPMEAHCVDGRIIRRHSNEMTLTGLRDINDAWCRNSDVINGFFGGKIYRSSVLDNIRLPIEMRNSEDAWLLCEVLPKCNTVRLSAAGAYIYWIHEGSLSFATGQGQKRRHAVNNMRVLIQKCNNAQRLNLSLETRVICFAYALTTLTSYVHNDKVPLKHLHESESFLHQHSLRFRQILLCHAPTKAKMKSMLAKILGIHGYVLLLGVIH